MPRASRAFPVAILLSCVSIVAISQCSCTNSGLGEKFFTVRLVPLSLHTVRSSPLDLEVGGDLGGVPAGSPRYLTREDLLALPQTSASVSDDPNLEKQARIAGVLLEELAKGLAPAADSTVVVAICSDRYRATYRSGYMSAHHPVLVLTINGKGPKDWPNDSQGHGLSKGPFLISHARFSPSYRILSHAEEAQIPWGVVRLEFRSEKAVFGAIAPRGPNANDDAVKNGFRIAEQNCFRCHNMGDEGGQKAGRGWEALAAWASASPQRFGSYVRSPQGVNPKAEMPAFPEYNDVTIAALRAYFTTFADASGAK